MIDVDYNEYKKTIAENMKLIKENHDLKERLGIYESDSDTVIMSKEKWEETKQEIKRLNNIIDELEHKLYQEWLEWKDSDCESIYVRAFEDKAIYDYIQELKGVDKE